MPSAKRSYLEHIEENIFSILFVTLIVLHFLARAYLAIILPGRGIDVSDNDLLSGLLFFSVIFAVDKFLKLGFKPRHYFIFFILAVLSFILNPLYNAFFFYDKFLHFTQSLLLSSLIFYMISKLKIKLKWALILTIFVMVGVGSIFELSEFGADSILGWKTQGVLSKTIQGKIGQLNLALDPLIDTNLDMLYNFLGSLSYTLLFLYEEYIHNKKRMSVRKLLNMRS